MKVLTGLIMTGLTLSLAATQEAGARGKPATRSPHRPASRLSTSPSRVIIAVDRGKALALLLSGNRTGRMQRVPLGPGSSLLSADGRSLRTASLRLGDSVTVPKAGRIVDLSQRGADVRGLVSFAPDSLDAPMVVALQHSHAIVVDLGSGTRYADRSLETSTPLETEDGDLLDVRGILDSALSEMTQTDSISRLGPLLHRLPGHRTTGRG